MTNNTKLLSVPRELLEGLQAFADKHWHGFPGDDKLRALLAAPAEDVRAVVEEPGAYELLFEGRQAAVVPKQDRALLTLKAHGDSRFKVEPLYRHPQRPVVLPASCDGITWKATGDANFYRLMKDGDWFAVMQFNGQPPVAAHEAFLNGLFGPEEGGQ